MEERSFFTIAEKNAERLVIEFDREKETHGTRIAFLVVLILCGGIDMLLVISLITSHAPVTGGGGQALIGFLAISGSFTGLIYLIVMLIPRLKNLVVNKAERTITMTHFYMFRSTEKIKSLLLDEIQQIYNRKIVDNEGYSSFNLTATMRDNRQAIMYSNKDPGIIDQLDAIIRNYLATGA